jgi:hypothetical protein
MPAALPKPSDHAEQGRRRSWRDVLPVHPACLAYPPLGKVELAELGADIKARGLEIDIVLIREGDKESLLDGRSRLDALEAKGIDLVVGCSLDRTLDLGKSNRVRVVADVDPYALVASLNAHRRHLTPTEKRTAIEGLIKASPEKSDRAIAEEAKTDHKVIGRARKRLESTGAAPQLTKHVGADGKARPAKRKKSTGADALAKKTASGRPVADDDAVAAPVTSTKKKSTAQIFRDVTAGADLYYAGLKNWRAMPSPDQDRFLSYLTDGGYDGTAFVLKRAGAVQVGSENDKRRLEIEIVGLRSEISELKAARASERPDVKTAAEIVEANFDEFVKVMPRGLREKLERKVRAEKNGGDGDIDPNATITRMLQEAMSCAVAAEDPNTDPGGVVAKSNRESAQKLLRDTERKLRAMRFALTDLVAGIAKGAKPRRAPTAANADTVRCAS